MSEQQLDPLDLVHRLNIAVKELADVERAIAELDRERNAAQLAELADRRQRLKRGIHCLTSILDVVADEIEVRLGGTLPRRTMQ